MNNDFEIKINNKSDKLFLLKNKIISIIKPLFVILFFVGVLYVGFYLLLFLIIGVGSSYFVNNLFRKN